MEFYSGQDLAGWLVSEKLDGVFARWSGGVLFTKEWRIIDAPAWLTACPDGEGEIWHKDGLERVQGCLAWGKEDSRWQGVKFVIHATIPAKAIASADEAYDLMNGVVAKGGEGVVAKNPKTGEMLKLKPQRDDEATVSGHTKGSGRNPGIGALVLFWRGKTFKLAVGLSHNDRVNPPAVGEVVTFCFDGLTSHGLPRNARFMRVRLAL